MTKAIIKNAVDYFLDGQTPVYEVAIALGIRGDSTDEQLQQLAADRELIETLDENKDRIYWEPRSYASLCFQVRKHVQSQERSWIHILKVWVRLIERDKDVQPEDRIDHVERFGHWDRMVEHFGPEKALEILKSIEPMTDTEKRKARIVFQLSVCTGGDSAASMLIVESLCKVLDKGVTAFQVAQALGELEKETDQNG